MKNILFKCNKCNKSFTHKNDFKKHLKRKKPCIIPKNNSEKELIHNNIQESAHNTCSQKSGKIICHHCDKTFTRNFNLTRHMMHFCRAKKNAENCEQDEYGGQKNNDQYNELITNSYDQINSNDQKLNTTNFTQLLVCEQLYNTIVPPTTSANKVNKKEYKCNYCNFIFSRKDSLNRHLDSRCKARKEQEETKEKIFKELITKMEMIEKKNVELQTELDNIKKSSNKQKSSNKHNPKENNQTNITNNNQNIQNNITNHNTIKLVAFGKEDLNAISEDVCKKLLSKGFEAVPSMIEYVHFNKNKPEYHNVYIPNTRDKYAMVYDGNIWGLTEYNEVIRKLCDDKRVFLEDKFNDFYDSLSESTRKKFERFLSEADSDPVKMRYKNDVKLMLYNKRGITINTKRLIDCGMKLLL